MKLTFFGAAGEVTGSSYLLETDRARILIDFGMHQGEQEADEHNRYPQRIEAQRLNAVVLTHAHIDHCGRLPMLVPAGFHGPIFATPATVELTDILLNDSARIQEADAERFNRLFLKPGQPPAKPLYTVPEVGAIMKLFRAVPYDKAQEVAPGISIRFVDAGHILGSASVEMTVHDRGRITTIAFSGDIGPSGLPILNDPTVLRRADVVLLESTYGDRDHRSREATVREFDRILYLARQSSGKVIIPAFAVGRTQDLIYEMSRLSRAGRFDRAKVYVDSPMATEVTALYRRYRELFDPEAKSLIQDGNTPLNFPGLRFTRSAEESKSLNSAGDGVVVIAASGMCTGGRVVHHLRHGLPKPETHVLIVGFQAAGTLGRRLVDGAPEVRIFGDPVPVRAQVHTLGGFSAHAGQSGLVQWAANFNPRPGRLILTHGEPKARDALHARLKSELGIDAERPLFEDTIEL